MAVTANQIYDYIVKKITADRTLYCTSRPEAVNSADHFPAVQIMELDSATLQVALPLDFSQKDSVSERRDFEVQVFSNLKNGALSEARDIMNAVERAFRELYFIQTTRLPIDNIDASITRLVARFTRNICDGDVLPNP